MSTTIKLKKPIEALGETFTELTFREPVGKDITACGIPMSGDNQINTAAVAALISRLGNIPPKAVDELSASDYLKAMTAIVDFFGTPEA